MLVPLTIWVWRFNTIFKQKEKRMDKNNRKLKILYKCIKANSNTSAIWQNAAHTTN